jgi:hypothetical protein
MNLHTGVLKICGRAGAADNAKMGQRLSSSYEKDFHRMRAQLFPPAFH